jgi:hypothetical protein
MSVALQLEANDAKIRREATYETAALLLTLLLVPTISKSQTVCFQYAGDVISCDRENGRYSTQVPLGRNQGVIQSERGIEPIRCSPRRAIPSAVDRLSRWNLAFVGSRGRRDRLDDPLTRSLLLGE